MYAEKEKNFAVARHLNQAGCKKIFKKVFIRYTKEAVRLVSLFCIMCLATVISFLL